MRNTTRKEVRRWMELGARPRVICEVRGHYRSNRSTELTWCYNRNSNLVQIVDCHPSSWQRTLGIVVKHLRYIRDYAYIFHSPLIPGQAHRRSIPRLYSRAHQGAYSHIIPPSPWLQYTHQDETWRPPEGWAATAHVIHNIIPWRDLQQGHERYQETRWAWVWDQCKIVETRYPYTYTSEPCLTAHEMTSFPSHLTSLKRITFHMRTHTFLCTLF